MPQSLHETSPILRYRGNSYSKLDIDQQVAIYERLLRKRHPLDMLRIERFLLENEPLSEGQAKIPGLEIGDFVAAPKRYLSIERRKVVAVDCLWGRTKDRRLELFAISAIDFLSGETLINSLVAPSKLKSKLLYFNHSIGPPTKAIKRGDACLEGWREARAKLFEYIDKETILVGHRTRDHLEALRLFHTELVDSHILTTSAVFKPSTKRQWYKWPLDKVCSGFVGINIDQDATSKDQLTCTLENVLASRETVIHCIQRPKEFEKWAKEARIEFFKQIEEQKDKRMVKKVKKNDHSPASPATQANAVPISDEKELLATYNDGYEAGYQAAYQAGFESGFKTGYKRRYKQTNCQVDQAGTKNGGQEEIQWEHQQNNHESVQDTDEENISSSRSEDTSQEEYAGTNEVTGPGNLLAHLMQDAKIEEMVQKVNQSQKEAPTASEQVKRIQADFRSRVEALRMKEEKGEEESRKARIERKLAALGVTNDGVKTWILDGGW
ncbi:hypothetical protein ACHAQJ_006645 [Trichoderma viride]